MLPIKMVFVSYRNLLYYTSCFFKVQCNFGTKKTFNKIVILFKINLLFIQETLSDTFLFHNTLLFTFFRGIAIIHHETVERLGLYI